MMKVGVTWKKTFLNNLALKCLMLGMFFNPFGFDIIQLYLISLTGNLYYADLVLYIISALFFGLYFLLKKRSK